MVDTPNIGGTIGQIMPKFNVGGMVSMIAWALVIILILVIIGVVAFIFIQRKKFKHSIVIFEKINGIVQDTGKDRAMEVALNKGGDSVFFLQKRKKYLPTPRLQSGRRKYYYFIREDGEWINVQLNDIDEQMRKVGAHFLDKEMRYARTELQKGLKERYEQKNWLKENLPMIITIGFIVLIGVMAWLIMDKWIGLAQTTNDGVKQSGEVMKLAKEILQSIDNIKTNNNIVLTK